jgi:hypothetical protein
MNLVLVRNSELVSTKYREMRRWCCLADLLHRFEFALSFRGCDQEQHEAFNSKSPTDAVEGLIEHEGVYSSLNSLGVENSKLTNAFREQ